MAARGTDRPDFRRVILSMGPGRVDRRTLKAVAGFARLLELEMVGVFVEDEGVLGLGGLPVRELRLPGQAWHPLDSARLADELHAAAQQARKLFAEEGATLGMASRFEVRRGNPATLALGQAEMTDIVVVCEPGEPASWASPAVLRARQSAMESRASVLVLPGGDALRRGPIAAVARHRSEPIVSLATHIARLAGEEMVFVAAERPSAGAIAASLDRMLGARRERLTVMARGAAGASIDLVSGLVAQRNTPVFLVD